jgi:hypothetical protein
MNPECCFHLGLALWLFFYYHIQRNRVPDFCDNSDW